MRGGQKVIEFAEKKPQTITQVRGGRSFKVELTLKPIQFIVVVGSLSPPMHKLEWAPKLELCDLGAYNS